MRPVTIYSRISTTLIPTFSSSNSSPSRHKTVRHERIEWLTTTAIVVLAFHLISGVSAGAVNSTQLSSRRSSAMGVIVRSTVQQPHHWLSQPAASLAERLARITALNNRFSPHRWSVSSQRLQRPKRRLVINQRSMNRLVNFDPASYNQYPVHNPYARPAYPNTATSMRLAAARAAEEESLLDSNSYQYASRSARMRATTPEPILTTTTTTTTTTTPKPQRVWRQKWSNLVGGSSSNSNTNRNTDSSRSRTASYYRSANNTSSRYDSRRKLPPNSEREWEDKPMTTTAPTTTVNPNRRQPTQFASSSTHNFRPSADAVFGHPVMRGPRGAGNKKLYYDVPQIECPDSETGMDRFACPSSDSYGRYLCIDDQHICNGYVDCPGGEDEDPMACMFYKSTKAHLDVLADYLLQWARARQT